MIGILQITHYKYEKQKQIGAVKSAFLLSWDSDSDCVYMDNLNLTMDLILIMAILWLGCLHELLKEYSVHIPRLHVAQHRLIKECSLKENSGIF